ncbi:hypothetical protein JCM14469_42600 [Desulfatiferula olefinivorans]
MHKPHYNPNFQGLKKLKKQQQMSDLFLMDVYAIIQKKFQLGRQVPQEGLLLQQSITQIQDK